MEAKASNSSIFVFGHLPSATNLIKSMLENQPQLEILDDSFREAYALGPEKLERDDDFGTQDSEAHKCVRNHETYQKAFDRMRKSMTRAEQKGKRSLFTEDAYVVFRPDVTSANLEGDHSLTMRPTPVIMTSKVMPTNYRCPLRASNSPHSSDSALFTATFPIFHPITEGLGIHTIESRPPQANPTVLPDAFLKSMTPICLIRNPAYTIPSLYHASVPRLNVHGREFPVQASLHWCRMLVDWYATTTGTKPIIVDCDDLINEPNLVRKLCSALSLDISKMQASWHAISQAEQDAATTTMQTSTSAARSKKEYKYIELDEEESVWAKEFGADAATAIKGHVVGARGDYGYLKRYTIE